jgi:post-segregation antitoxin (ccd killing protein)
MPTDLYNPYAPKKATNHGVNEDLLELEKPRWLATNLDVLDHYNQRIEADGVSSDDPRRF